MSSPIKREPEGWADIVSKYEARNKADEEKLDETIKKRFPSAPPQDRLKASIEALKNAPPRERETLKDTKVLREPSNQHIIELKTVLDERLKEEDKVAREALRNLPTETQHKVLTGRVKQQ